MAEIRLIDGNELRGIESLLNTDIIQSSKEASWLMSQVLHDIDAMLSIDPETLPIVRDLRAELERVTRERDELIRDMKIFGSGCYSCKHFDRSNGKCRAEELCGVNNNWEWRGIQWEE